jgi:GNAT superfamily N-acetyltransferase
VQIRPIEPADAEAYRSILLRTSDEDRYCRFFHAVAKTPDPAEIAHFTTRDASMTAFIALEEKPLGVVHGFLIGDGSVEFSVLVARDARRRGVARALVLALLEELNDSECTELIAFSLAENLAFATLARSFNMSRSVDGNFVTWKAPLNRDTTLAALTQRRDTTADGRGTAGLSPARSDWDGATADFRDAVQRSLR